ncbi:hypothetical protein [Providencia stuartii]
MALAWVLAEQPLKGLLPKVVLDQSQIQFDLEPISIGINYRIKNILSL